MLAFAGFLAVPKGGEDGKSAVHTGIVSP